MHTRWRMPPESCAGKLVAKSERPTRLSTLRTRSRFSSLPRFARRRPKATLSATLSQGSEASSWNTTPMPSGAWPAIGRPSNSIEPSVAGVRPAISSSSVDLPQPEGPTTAKNSPRLRSRSTGPTACGGAGGRPVMNTWLTPESLTCSAVTGRPKVYGDKKPSQSVASSPECRSCQMRSRSETRDSTEEVRRGASEDTTKQSGRAAALGRLLFDRLEIVGQKPRVDDLVVIDLTGDRADRALRFDHPLQAFHVDLALAPVRHAFCLAGRQVAHGAFRHVELDVVLLGDNLGGLVRIRDHELDRLPPGTDDRAQEVALLFRHLHGGHADDVVERRQHFTRDDDRPVLVLDFRPERLGDRCHIDLTRIQRSNPFTEPARLDQLGVGLGVTAGLQQHPRERLARRARIGVADFLALEVFDRLDR